MSRIGPISQDWEPVTIRKKPPNAAAKKDEKAVNAARRAGAEIETLKKSNAGTNRAASSSTSLNTRKLDDDTENLAHNRVPSELKKAIMQARLDKKLTQAQLAQIINEKPQIIQEYESGKAIPNQQIIGKLERALGTKLRGLKIGEGSSKFNELIEKGSSFSQNQKATKLRKSSMDKTTEKSKLNIAIIHPDLGIGGAERLIVDAAVELTSHGHNVHIFTTHHDKKRCFEETLTGTFSVSVYGDFLPRQIFYRLHALCAYLRCIYVALCVLFLWPSFDVVLADQVSVVIPLLKLKKSIKVVFYCHFPDLLLAQHTTSLRRIYRKPIDFIEEMTTGMADVILVNSKFTASTFANTFKHLHSKGVRPAVLYPAVNIEQFCAPDSYKLNLLSINRFERKKNIDLAVSAFAMLHHSQKDNLDADVTLTIAGGYDKRLRENVEYLEELKSLAEREGVSDKVKFVTSCSTAERNTLLSECLCVIYTPKDEHFGIVPLEAMAAHKPVIACNSGGPVETVIDGVTGFLCEPKPLAFSSAMAKFTQDPEMARKMGEEARRHVTESFSTKTFGEQLNSFITEVTGRKED